jgi:hypothetical protein
MTRNAAFLAILAVTALAAPAGAQVLPMTARPIVLPEGVGQLSADVQVGLNAGNPGGMVGLSSGLPGDRQPGLSVAYGLARGIEGGLWVPYVNMDLRKDLVESYDLAMQGWPLRRDTRTRHHFGPVGAWAGFRLTDWLAAEIAVIVPIEDVRANRAAARASLVLRYPVMGKRVSLRLRPDLTLGFGRADENQGASVQVSFFVDAGVTWNVTTALWLDAGIGYGRMFQPSPDTVLRDWPGTNPKSGGWLPVSVSLGYTVTETVDVFGGFTLANLTPGSTQGPADARSLTVGVNYRF